MNAHLAAEISTRGDVQDLARIIGVLAVLDLTPSVLTAVREATGFRIRLEIDADEAIFDRCIWSAPLEVIHP